jgi:hypothetical protein
MPKIGSPAVVSSHEERDNNMSKLICLTPNSKMTKIGSPTVISSHEDRDNNMSKLICRVAFWGSPDLSPEMER